ncbi:MAG TPA: hypothetical protein VF771_11640 [Longimicrobiaceae bacterium]
MPVAREVTDEQGIRWSCVEAYAGLSADANGGEAAKVEGAEERFRVVCTPSGGAKSVELHLPGGWEEALSDDELLREIAAARDEEGSA